MMSLSSSIMSLCMTLYPILVQFSKNLYGLRGCLALIAAVNMNTFIAMLIMHPFEWHSKRVLLHSNILIYKDFKHIVQFHIFNNSRCKGKNVAGKQ